MGGTEFQHRQVATDNKKENIFGIGKGSENRWKSRNVK
jgi:hypothetical protein